jgi:signal transduction histidine kinase
MIPGKAKPLPPSALSEMLLRQSPGCNWLLRPDRVFHAVYGDAARVFGRAAVELEKANFIDLFAEPARASWTGRVERVFSGQTLRAAGRFNGGPAWSITLFPVAAPEGGIPFVGGTAHTMGENDMALRMLQAIETDRAGLFRLLHDRVGQYLSAAGLQLDLLRMDLAESDFPITARTAEIQATLETVMGVVRDLHYQLNPDLAERVGLCAALDRLAGHLRTDFHGNVRVLADSTAQCGPAAAAALYRIAQEAAGDATRRAGCSTIEILLKSMRKGTALEVRDNGQGFDAAESVLQKDGLGLLVMQYHADRAGIELEIDSAPGRGTVVRAVCSSGEKSER